MSGDAPYEKESILEALDDAVGQVVGWFSDAEDRQFTAGPAGKWTAGQHLDHLIRSTKPVTTALKLPKLVPGLLFGKALEPSLDYDGVVARYRAALDAGGKASGRFVPPDVAVSQRDRLIADYSLAGTDLHNTVLRWDEGALDTYRLPHPLIGKLTVREMLLFTVYHTRLHRAILDRDYA
jgi:hypothetical protein